MPSPVRIFIPIICYNHQCHSSFMFSLISLVLVLKEQGIDVSLYPIGFDSLVNRARNAAVALFMSAPYTHLLFLDTDIEFNPQDIIRLIRADEKIIGAAYAQKWLNVDKIKEVFKKDHLPPNPMHLCVNQSVTPDSHVISEKMEITYLTTGCMLINKNVIDLLIRAYPERQYVNDIDGYKGADSDKFFNFFSVEINPYTQQYESEDYCFCRLWKEQGGQVYLIPDITLTHFGWFGYASNMKANLEYETTK